MKRAFADTRYIDYYYNDITGEVISTRSGKPVALTWSVSSWGRAPRVSLKDSFYNKKSFTKEQILSLLKPLEEVNDTIVSDRWWAGRLVSENTVELVRSFTSDTRARESAESRAVAAPGVKFAVLKEVGVVEHSNIKWSALTIK